MNKIITLLSIIRTLIIQSKKNIFFGGGTKVYYKSRVCAYKGSISVGKNCLIGRSRRNYHASMSFYTTLFTDKEGAEIYIGNNCRINGAYIHAQKAIKIGDNCVIASGVNIIDSNGHIVLSSNRTIGRDDAKSIEIGSNVWIGLNSTILKNTTIGNNCVIAAGSVVKGQFPDNVLIQGNPAVVVKKLEL